MKTKTSRIVRRLRHRKAKDHRNDKYRRAALQSGLYGIPHHLNPEH